MISEFVQLLQEAETSDINSRIRHLLVELLNSTAAENIDALFRLCRHLLSTRPSLFETQNDDQCVVKVLRKKCAAYGDHELCRLIDLHMPFTVPRLGDILDGPNDEVHGGKSSVPQLGARKRRREDSEVLEPCVQKLLPKLNVGFVAETDISEMELWCLPATVVMHPTKIAEALHLASALIGRYPLIVSKIISHFACAARQGLSFAAGLQGKIYYQCNCDLNNSDKYPKDSSVAQLFGTITSLALPPFTVPQRLHAFQTINHLIQHACLGFNPIGKQEISDLLVRSIESSCRWIRKASTELYQVAARADLLDISLHKKIIQLAKNPENADEIISIALSLLSVTNTHSEIECDAAPTAEMARQEELLELLDRAANHCGMTAVYSTIQLSKMTASEISVAYCPSFLVRLLSKSLLEAAGKSLYRLPVGEILMPHLEYIVPSLVLSADKVGLAYICVQLHTEYAELIVDHADSILYEYFMNNYNQTSLYNLYSALNDSSHEVIQDENTISAANKKRQSKSATGDKKMSLSLLQLLKTCLQKLMVKLCFALGHPQKFRIAQHAIVKCFEILVSPGDKPTSKGLQFKSVESFVLHFFLGVLHDFLNNRLLSESDTGDKKIAVQALSQLIQWVGTPIAKYSAQVVNFLTKAHQSCELIPACISAWKFFAENVKMYEAPDSLDVLMSALSNVLDCSNERQIHDIFNFLLIRDGKNVMQKSPYLFVFLPRITSFSQLRQFCSKAIAEASPDGINFTESLNDQSLEIFSKAIAHENLIVVSTALSYICGLLESDRNKVVSTYVLSESVSRPFKQFVNRLFTVLERSADSLVLEKCMACIGLIGAIDPGRLGSLDLEVASRNQEASLMLLVSERACVIKFICKIIEQVLVPAFRATSNTMVQDRLAFLMQELLKSAGFSAIAETLASENYSDKDDSEEIKAWRSFPRDVQEIITPLLTSKYYIRLADPLGWTAPIYPICESFSEWVQRWTASLLGLLRMDDPVYELLKPCQAILTSSCDSALAASLLPYIILYLVVQYGDTEKIFNEILSVLSFHCLNGEFASIFHETHLSDKDLRCAQTIFRIYGLIKEWEKSLINLAIERQINQRKAESSTIRNQIVPVKKFLASIPCEKMAAAAFQCGYYQRALFHYEQYLRADLKNATQQRTYDLFENMHKIYSRVDELDGLEGVQAMLFKHGNGMSLDQQIIANYSSNRWNDAQSSLEVALQTSNGSGRNEIFYHIGLLDCLKNLGHLEMMLTHLKGVRSENHENRSWNQVLDSYGAEAAWRLGQWDSLSELLNNHNMIENGSFEVAFGKLLCSIRQRDQECVAELLSNARCVLGPQLRSVVSDSYGKSYDTVVKLHMIEEVRICWEFINDQSKHNQNGYDNLLQQLDYRLRCCSSIFKHQEPILNLRRILLDELSTVLQGNLALSASKESKIIWLVSAKLARKSGNFQTAFSALLRAESELMDSAIFLERSRLFHATGRHELAFRELSHALRSKGDPNSDPIDPEVSVVISTPAITLTPVSERETNLRAKGALLLARWLQQSSFGRTVDVEAWYKEVTVVSPKWEKAWFFIGRYYNQLLDERNSRYQTICEALEATKDRNDRRNAEKEKFDSFLGIGEAIAAVIKCYSRSLQYGTQNIFRSLPRLITLWLDFTVPIADDLKEKKSGIAVIRTQTITAINNYISSMIKKTPSFVFLTTYPQLLSRICHQNESVTSLLHKIIANVLMDYPQQALWHLVSVSKTSDIQRARKCNEVIASCKGNANVRGLCKQAMSLADQLLHLCNFKLPDNHQGPMSMAKDFSALKSAAPLDLIVPLQASLTVTLPERKTTTSYAGHRPFTAHLPTIRGFVERIDIMNSLQKPRRIGVIGSDGKVYHFLCKPNDDLRKDSRVLEFYGMINKLLNRNSESRRRNLKIRTYAVVALNEECGLIEWVPATTTFRHIISRLYKSKGIVCGANLLREWKDLAGTNPKRAQEFFLSQLLKLHQPPVFHQWFIDSFSRPDSWFAARLAWTRSAAVMSMVGFVVGLGDRHAENILVDETNGELMHVDFNCLFEKGIAFDFPELVPFRLTHNMVDGFGVTGTDGVFFKCAELTLKMLRENKESLMSVLEAFVHDPLVEWTKRGSSNARASSNFKPVDAPEQGRRVLKNIANKLDGGMGLTHQLSTLIALPSNKSGNIHSVKEALFQTAQGLSDTGLQVSKRLGLEAQVVELIETATNQTFLSQMWIGWSSFY